MFDFEEISHTMPLTLPTVDTSVYFGDNVIHNANTIYNYNTISDMQSYFHSLVLNIKDLDPLFDCLSKYEEKYKDIKKKVRKVDYLDALIIESSDLIKIEMDTLFSRMDSIESDFYVIKGKITGKAKIQQQKEIKEIVANLKQDNDFFSNVSVDYKSAYDKCQDALAILYESSEGTEAEIDKFNRWGNYYYSQYDYFRNKANQIFCTIASFENN